MHIQFTFGDPSKAAIARQLGIPFQSDDGTFTCEDSLKNIDTLLLAARLHCLSKDEIYFLQDASELLNPLNHRNEAAAISFLLQSITHENNATLQDHLIKHCQDLWPVFKHGDETISNGSDSNNNNNTKSVHNDAQGEQQDNNTNINTTNNNATAAFHMWTQQNNIQSLIQISNFNGLRGCSALRDISSGDNILSIPRKILIYDETVLETDLGRMLKVIPGLSMDNLLIIWTMIDRFDTDSQWYPFWKTLPDAYFTGLTFPSHLIDYLQGTAAYLELQRAQHHLKNQYEATKPLLDILLQAYPSFLTEDMFSFKNYMWAVELYYSYAFEIEFPPNKKSKTVMVPFACHVNHSPWPHVVRYGKINVETDTLDYPAFRPCNSNNQVFISYGPVPNLKLLCYYGFSLVSNPHDVVPLSFEEPDGGLTELQQKALEQVFASSLLQQHNDDDNTNDGDNMSSDAVNNRYMEHSLRDGPLSKQLLACIRIIVATDEELEMSVVIAEHGASSSSSSRIINPLNGAISSENEERTRETLQNMITVLMEPVDERIQELESILDNDIVGDGRSCSGGNENGFDDDWRMSSKFCLVYLQGQKKILMRAMKECCCL